MKNDSIFTRLRRTLSLALTALIAATMMACEGDDKMLTELPKPDDGNGNGTTEITPDKGITLYGLVSDKEGNPLEGVVVSDGYSVVASDKKGVYQIVRDPSAKHVFISVPSATKSRHRRTSAPTRVPTRQPTPSPEAVRNPTGRTSRSPNSPKATNGSCSSGWETRSPTTATISSGSARKPYPM